MSVRDRVAIYLETLSRSRVLQIVCVGWIVSVSACSNGARQDPVVEFSTEVGVSSDKQTSVSRSLQAGTYLVEVHESEIDVQVAIDAGGIHAELGDDIPRHGAIYKVVSLGAPAELRVQVRSTDHRTKIGRAVVRIARFKRAGGEQPSDLELGFATFGMAGEQLALDTPASLTRAADLLHEALTRFDAARDDDARAAGAYALANVQYARDEWSAAVRATESATEAYQARDDQTGAHNAATLRSAAELELAASMNAGTQRAEQNAMYEAADRRLKDAGEYFAAHNLLLRAEYAVNMRGIRAASLGELDAADALFSRALEMALANADIAERVKVLSNLAYVHYRRGYVTRAAQEYESLLPFVDRKLEPYKYAALLGNYGFMLVSLGDFDRALELHIEALDLYTTLGEQDEVANELAALGGLYFRMGDTGRALETLRAAIAAQEKVSDARGLASTLRIAGNAASELGQHTKALEYLRRSTEIDANPHSVARTRVLIAAELRAVGDLRSAAAELATPLKSVNALVHANALEERARLRRTQRDLAGAIDDLRSADRQYVDLALDFNRIGTNTELSQLLLETHDLPGASAAADEAISIVSRIRAKSANPEWRARFLAARYAPFEARIAVDLADDSAGAANSIWRGFRTAEDVRARSLADELAFDARGGVRAADSGEQALRAQLTSQQLRLEARMQRQDADEAGLLEARRAVEETRALIDRNRLSHGITTSASSLPGSLQQVQQKLPADTAVLTYFVGDTDAHAWLLSKRGLRHATFPGREPLQRVIDAAVTELRNTGAEGPAGRKLGEALFGRLLADVPEKRLLVVPDGPLNGVPFASLPIPGAGRELLIDRFVLGYAPSLALAMETRHQKGARPSRVAVVSDPVYAPDDRRLQLAANDSGGNFRGPPPPSPNNLTRLPYSAIEASAVMKAFGGTETIQLSGFDATAPRVMKLPFRDLAVLHFATHALARRDSPEQSALYLSEYASNGTLLPDSLLTARDIARAGLRADVVVLSGCATGDGGELRGEGVLGLTYGFLANGSHSVVAALWPIEDASTARFMSEFYRAYRLSGRASEALRTAQLRTRDTAAPAVWSSFVVRANEFP
ncbi:MAG TPA: CHAT domain-containing tetratricopeptide repeat protein [Steroidobacteraceae bacterium]|nr:CHAT domain-containing tetratricopeptide repeat protein [Steroidobacteraceae bacterium]